MGKSAQQFLLAQKQQAQVVTETTKKTGISKAALKILLGVPHPRYTSCIHQSNPSPLKMKG
jgi:hypothetical protein